MDHTSIKLWSISIDDVYFDNQDNSFVYKKELKIFDTYVYKK